MLAGTVPDAAADVTVGCSDTVVLTGLGLVAVTERPLDVVASVATLLLDGLTGVAAVLASVTTTLVAVVGIPEFDEDIESDEPVEGNALD